MLKQLDSASLAKAMRMSPRFNRLGKREELWRRLSLRSEAKPRILNPKPQSLDRKMTQRAVAQAEFEVRDGTVYPFEKL